MADLTPEALDVESGARLDDLDLCGYCNAAECGIDHSVEGCPADVALIVAALEARDEQWGE